MAEPRVVFAFKVYRRPFRRPVQTSHGTWESRDGILIRIEHEDGRCGFGEIAPLERFGTETLAGAVAWCASLGRLVSPVRLREGPRGMPCCAAAVAAAFASAAPLSIPTDENPNIKGSDGRAGTPFSAANIESQTTAGTPFPALPADVAGTSDRSTRASDLAVACLLPTGEAAREALARAVDAGFTTFKLKIGTTAFAVERTAVARLVEQLPSRARLRLDANGGLELRDAVRWLDAAGDWPVEFIEQPLPVEGDRDLARLAHDHAVPVALDESVRGADDIKRWRDRGWPGVFVIKPALAGAPEELVSEVRIQPEQFVFSSALETVIGAAAGMRLAFAAGVTRALGYGVAGFFADDGFGGGWSQPTISPADLEAMSAEDTWNRL